MLGDVLDRRSRGVRRSRRNSGRGAHAAFQENLRAARSPGGPIRLDGRLVRAAVAVYRARRLRPSVAVLLEDEVAALWAVLGDDLGGAPAAGAPHVEERIRGPQPLLLAELVGRVVLAPDVA